MATNYYVGYPFSSTEVTVPASGYLAVASFGEGTCSIYKKVNYPQAPSSWSLVDTISNESEVYSLAGYTCRIDAGCDRVNYSTGTDSQTLSAIKYFPSPSGVSHVYMNDFDTFAAADWTITETGAGGTVALISGKGGLLRLLNDTADNDNEFMQLVAEGFLFQTTNDIWFEARFKTNDATETDIVFGLQITDTSPLSVTDGVYFIKSDGAATADFKVVKDSTATTTSAVATLADNTFITLGFHYDSARSTTDIYVDKVLVGSSVMTNMPDDEELTLSFGVQNGAAAAKRIDVDYVMVAQQR